VRWNGNYGAFHPHVAVAWEHEFKDTVQTVNASFAEAPGSNFKVVSTELDEDSFVLDAGFNYDFDAASYFTLRYYGRFQSDYDSSYLLGRFTYKFGAAPAPAPEPLKLAGE
jgi:uncharacterized protein with beta-barrel porin domain